MTAVLGAIAATAGLVLLAASRPRATVEGQGGALSGAMHTPGATALALVALAGVGALVLVGGRARSVIAALLVLVAAGVVVTMAAIPSDDDWFTNTGVPPAATRSAWAWLGMGAGVLLGLAAAVAAVRARRWPHPRRGDESSTSRTAPTGDAWDAIDRGEDPTT